MMLNHHRIAGSGCGTRQMSRVAPVSARRIRRNRCLLAAGWILLATSSETLHAQFADLFFEGVLLVDPAPPAEVVVPVSTGNAMGMNAAGNAMGGGGQGATGEDGGQGGMGGGGRSVAGGGGQGGMGGGAVTDGPPRCSFSCPRSGVPKSPLS